MEDPAPLGEARNGSAVDECNQSQDFDAKEPIMVYQVDVVVVCEIPGALEKDTRDDEEEVSPPCFEMELQQVPYGSMINYHNLPRKKTKTKTRVSHPVPEVSVEDVENIVNLYDNPSEDSLRIYDPFPQTVTKSSDSGVLEAVPTATSSASLDERVARSSCFCSRVDEEPPMFSCGLQEIQELNEDLDLLRQDFEGAAVDFTRAVTSNGPLTSKELRSRRGSLQLQRNWRGKITPRWAKE